MLNSLNVSDNCLTHCVDFITGRNDCPDLGCHPNGSPVPDSDMQISLLRSYLYSINKTLIVHGYDSRLSFRDAIFAFEANMAFILNLSFFSGNHAVVCKFGRIFFDSSGLLIPSSTKFFKPPLYWPLSAYIIVLDSFEEHKHSSEVTCISEEAVLS